MPERRTAKRVSPDPAPRPASGAAPGQAERDDPFGRQVFFSTGPQITASGHGRIRAECSSCGETRRMTLPDVVRAHFPVWAWVPVLHSPHWMRCPACSRRTWVRLTPVLGDGSPAGP